MHKLCFVGVRFYNVKYQASIITNCNFRNANLIGIDFFNCNLRGTSFKNTSFKNVVFYNCNLRDADFKDAIFGNMDSQLFLGGTEPTTLKDLSQFLGKETIDMYNTGESRGNNPSYSMNYQKSGKDLMTVDEIAVMDGDKCILQLRGVRPFLSDKYDVTQHPLYKETGEYDERNKLDIQRFLHQGIKVKSGEMFDVVRI
nr:pentapeptide repeat-containing protein [Lachnobacterium bovis]